MVILFDGVCNMCNRLVLFVIKYDRKGIFQFASLQSVYGISLQKHFNIYGNGLDTVLVYNGQKVISQSDAVLTILKHLGGTWKAFVIFKIIPRFIRNSIYNFIAKRRYSIFGKRDSCMVPDERTKNRFIDNELFS